MVFIHLQTVKSRPPNLSNNAATPSKNSGRPLVFALRVPWTFARTSFGFEPFSRIRMTTGPLKNYRECIHGRIGDTQTRSENLPRQMIRFVDSCGFCEVNRG
jgi:hypothetical protein